jgi:hypothetical protein
VKPGGRRHGTVKLEQEHILGKEEERQMTDP